MPPPLSDSGSSPAAVRVRSRGSEKKHVVPSSRLPPSLKTAPWQLIPSRFPATIVFRRITAVAGTTGKLSDSTEVERPLPASARLSVIVTLVTRSSASAFVYRPPPRSPAVLSESVLFSIEEFASPISM